MKIARYPLTSFGYMYWADFVEAAQMRLGDGNWRMAFVDQTATIPAALDHAEAQGIVPPKLFRKLNKLLPAAWKPAPRDPELSRILQIAQVEGVL